MGRRWEVVGGVDKGGILVREGQALGSSASAQRLSTGAEVEELEIIGDRLHYQLVSGTGPTDGWVSIKVSGKDLLALRPEVELVMEPSGTPGVLAGPGAGYRHRWAVNIEDWHPRGEADGREFQFMLNLIREDDDRNAVMKFKFFEDRKRALCSRLLVRQASASALNMRNFETISIKRTKGRKPFLAYPLPCEHKAPNWNVNASHEGSWVVLASEPMTVAGIDVAELRRTKKNGEPIDFHSAFKDNLTSNEWNHVNSHGPCLDQQYEVFSRFWSAKEAFVKARGDGIAFPLGQAEFHWNPLAGYPPGSAYDGEVVIEGQRDPAWRFVQHRMPGEKPGDRPHWTTVGRGPLKDIVDAYGEFTSTLRRPYEAFSDDEWKEQLLAESPHFDVIPVGALVPQDAMDAYVEAGGTRYP